jgi:hypothetical protein
MKNECSKHHRQIENRRRPRTAIADAFLRALFVYVAKHHSDCGSVTIPAGTVTIAELRQVVCALLQLNQETARGGSRA